MWQYWLIASGIFFVGEIMTVGFLLFWFGIASLITMVVSFFTHNLIIQFSVFLISSVILILATKPLVNKFLKTKSPISTNISSLIGKTGIVIEEINNNEGLGQIKVGGELWSAKNIDNTIINSGAKVEIAKIEGVKAIVKQK